MQKGAEPKGAASLLQMLQEGKHDGGILNNLGGLLGRGFQVNGSHLLGKEPVSAPFRRQKPGGSATFIASASGISKNASSSLLEFSRPFVMGFLGKTLKAQGGLNINGLTNLLLGRRISSSPRCRPGSLS